MSVITLTEAKAHLNIVTASTSLSEPEIQSFITRAEAALVKRIGCPLVGTSKTERVPGVRAVLRLTFAPVISLTSVTSVEGSAIPVGQLTHLSGGRVEFSQYGYFPSRFYDVTYMAGWAESAGGLPEDLRFAALELIRHMADTQRAGGSRRPGSAPSETVANTVPGAAYMWPFRVEQLIEPYLPTLGA